MSAIAQSIKARLLREAQRREMEFEPFLVRYACERFLFRLGQSRQRDRCTLKGAGLLTLWMEEPYRATRDVDLLAVGPPDEAAVRETMQDICRQPCPEDGLELDLDTLTIEAIRDEQRYAGQRAVVRAYLGKARIRLQVDFGFGDALSTAPDTTEIPTLIDGLPAPVVHAYPRVATVAEKFEAMVQLGRRNSRMKDFHDIWALSEAFPFEGTALRTAIERCFDRRGTAWNSEIPDVLTSAFCADPDVEARWRAYLRRGFFRQSPPQTIDEIGERVRSFFGPVREAILAGTPFDRHWPPGGPWAAGPRGRLEGQDG